MKDHYTNEVNEFFEENKDIKAIKTKIIKNY